LSSEPENFDPLNPGWFLQWAVDRAVDENPGKNIVVLRENGAHLFSVNGEGNTGAVTLVTDGENLHCQVYEA